MHALYSNLFGRLVVLALIVPASGCLGPRNFENENDQLRAERLKQQRLIEDLQRTLERRTGRIAALEQQVGGSKPMPGVQTPSLARIAFGRYSSAVDSDEDGKDDLIRIYLEPKDQQGRLIPVAGRAKVQAALVEPNEKPRVVAERTYEPSEFDDAYRSTLLGRHYTLELPLGDDLPSGKTELTVKVRFTNAATGAEHTRQKAVGVER